MSSEALNKRYEGEEAPSSSIQRPVLFPKKDHAMATVFELNNEDDLTSGMESMSDDSDSSYHGEPENREGDESSDDDDSESDEDVESENEIA